MVAWLKKVCWGVGILALTLTADADQKVSAYVYWGDAWKGNQSIGSYISPSSANVQKNGAAATFTASSFEGWKVTKWMKATNGGLLNPTQLPYGKYTEYAGSPTFSWSYDSTMGESTTCAICVRFDPIVYSLQFNPNGGSGEMSEQTKVYTNVYQAASCSFTRSGYVFDKWEVSGKGTFSVGDTINTGKALGVTTDGQVVTMKALWKEATVTATLDCNGEGASVSPASVSVTYLGVYPELPIPVRGGYAFDGWYTQAEGGTAVKAGTTCMQTGAHVLYAHWTKLWTVTFVDSSLFGSATLTNCQVRHGGSVSAPTPPTHAGYTFTGWLGYSSFSQIEQDRTYTANYQANSYTVCFHKNDGSDLVSNQYGFKYGEQKALATGVFTRTGYTFKGWAETAGSKTVKYSDGANVVNLVESGTYDLYAVWEPNVYQVSFNPNGGTGTMSPVQMVYDQPQALPSNAFTWSGVEFQGWLGPDGKHYANGAVVSNLSTGAAVELKAQWSQTYYVVFDGNGANNVEEYVQSYEGGQDVKPLTANRYARTGYTFGGWATSPADAAKHIVAYADGAQFSLPTATPGMTYRLYAVWSNNPYRVIFDGNGAEAGSMVPQAFVYDVPQALNANGFERDAALWEFVGWTNKVTGIAYAPNAVVSNLTAEANGTVTLHACWNSLLSDLSKAMKCENLNWVSVTNEYIKGKWIADWSGIGVKGGSCAVLKNGGRLGEMTTCIHANGLLRFNWKVSKKSAEMYVGLEGVDRTVALTATAQDGEWNCAWIDTEALWTQIGGAGVQTFPQIIYLGKRDKEDEPAQGFVDCVTWYPGGTLPEPSEEDRPVVNNLTIGGDGVSLTVSNVSEIFDYRLNGTNDLTAPMPWPVLKSVPGVAGGTLELSVPKQSNEPRMFYTVEVLKKQ